MTKGSEAMTEKDDNKKNELFFPYYVNQGRLLDIYAILNGGYSEYSEITTTISDEINSGKKGEGFVKGGFKIFDFGFTYNRSFDEKNSQGSENREKKIQTVSSMLNIVKTTLAQNDYLREIQCAKAGDFVCLPVVLSINSIKSQLSEMADLLRLADTIQNIDDKKSKEKNKHNNSSQKNNNIDGLLKTIQTLFEGEEIIYQTDDFAIIGNIVDGHLYQAVRSDIIGTYLTCLAQVKRVYDNGTELMKNTTFSKIQGNDIKQPIIDSLLDISKNNFFEFEAVAIPSIKDKPVYELEIIALFQ